MRRKRRIEGARFSPARFLLQHSNSVPAFCIETVAEESCLQIPTIAMRALEDLSNRKLFDSPP